VQPMKTISVAAGAAAAAATFAGYLAISAGAAPESNPSSRGTVAQATPSPSAPRTSSTNSVPTAVGYWSYRETRNGAAGASSVAIVINAAGDADQHPFGITRRAFLSSADLDALPRDRAALGQALRRQGYLDQQAPPSALGPKMPRIPSAQAVAVGALDVLQDPIAGADLRRAVVAVVADLPGAAPTSGVRDSRNRMGTRYTLATPNDQSEQIIVSTSGRLLEVDSRRFATSVLIDQSGPTSRPPTGFPRF
jgi:hypothetical protein